MGNPRKAVAALMPLNIDCGEGLTVKPMTLAMWAALERIDSPLVTGKSPKDTLELLPSLYLLTHGPEELLTGNLLAKSVTWADTIAIDAMSRIQQACSEQIDAVVNVIPEGGKKKVQTAGSRRLPTTSQRSTTGAGGRSSGKLR